MRTAFERAYEVGAELHADGVDFRVYASTARSVDVEIDGFVRPLERLDAHTFGAFVAGVSAGARYAFRLDGGRPLPDPASRYQPDGPHGTSCVVDPAFPWTDADWPGPSGARQVIYEMHVGTFTPERTWAAAAAQLTELADLGVTMIEVMPIAEFAGRFGWGYDGVQLFAPYHGYGTPHDVRAFIDRAHALGLSVLLDVVYNHLGPDGDYLREFVPEFRSRRHVTDWGPCLDFDGPGRGIVRPFVLSNVAYWIREFHFDGLRIDATQDVHDDSDVHILREVVATARRAGLPRRVHLSGENEPQDARLLRPESDHGFEFDTLWNDDAHHSARVALTGRRDGYYQDYTGSAQEMVALATRGWLYQGQYYPWQRQRRGTSAFDIGPDRLIVYLQNHDQIANSLRGERIDRLAEPAALRALTAFVLLGPSHVLLFQGQEYAAPQPFLYFADQAGAVGEQVAHGRWSFLQQFESIAALGEHDVRHDPRDESTLVLSTLEPRDRRQDRHAQWLALHRDLIRLCTADPVLGSTMPEGAVLGRTAFALRWHADAGDRLLIVNLGALQRRSSIAEPLLAPPEGQSWAPHWSSEDVRYGGHGTPAVQRARSWHLPARSAVLLAPRPTTTAELESNR